MVSVTIQQAVEMALGHYQAGRAQQAAQICQAILAQQPDNHEVMNLLGLALHAMGQTQTAITMISRAAQLNPGAVAYLTNLGEILRAAGRLPEARQTLERAVQLEPANAPAWYNLGTVLQAQGALDEAGQAYRQALAIHPDYAVAWNNLGVVQDQQDRLDQAVIAYRRALAINPSNSDALNNLGLVLSRRGEIDEAIASLRGALALQPQAREIHSQLIYTLLHHPGYDAQTLFREHLEWGRIHAQPLAAQIKPHQNDRNPDRPLRIGYVSPNFRRHAVSYFFEPYFFAHDRDHVHVTLYSDVQQADQVTQRIKSGADNWRDIFGKSDDQVTEQIRADAIDILVDLTGHIPDSRLLVFARKPAPVQVTYLGYQATTGMSTMDWRLTDAIADPPGQTEKFHTEKLWRLPVFFVYQPLENSPEVSELPAAKSGFITFGSMNHFVKVTPQMIEIWARLLDQVPNSRLRLLIQGGAQGNQHVLAQFAGHGIEAGRLELVAMRPVREFLQLFNTIDIALDPFPFSGHTTTCDSLWMGVPVIALAGDSYVSRMNVSVLTNMNMTEWIAEKPDEYVKIASEHAADIPGLARLRRSLRQNLQQSPIMDSQRFARDLEAAYRQMWRQWVTSAP